MTLCQYLLLGASVLYIRKAEKSLLFYTLAKPRRALLSSSATLPWLKRRHFFLSVLIYNQNIKQDGEIQAHIEKIQDSAQAGDARNGHILYSKDFGSSGHRSIEFNDKGDRIRMLYRIHSYLRGIRE